MTAELSQRRILLVDDDDLIAGSLRRYLVMRGCEVDVATAPRTARELMNARAYDVIVVDPYLTGGVHQPDGEIIAGIRALQPAAAIIVLTAYGSQALHRAASDGTIAAILTKPKSIQFLSQFVVTASKRAGQIAAREEG